MPKGQFPEDYPGDPVTQFVLQWNLWSTSTERRAIYRKARKGGQADAAGLHHRGGGEPGRGRARAHRALPDEEPADLDAADEGFAKVRKKNWRLGAVVDQTNFDFRPSVTRLTSCKRKIVMLYVTGDPAA